MNKVNKESLFRIIKKKAFFMEIYIVTAGDTIDSIANIYGAKVDSIIYANQLVYPYALVIGQALLIPVQAENGGSDKYAIYTNGFAYPFISHFVLRETLPYLSALSVFSYGFTTEGEIVPPLLADEFMIALAKEYNTKPVLTLAPFGADGRFNNYLVSVVSNNMETQQTLISNLIDIVLEKGFLGVDIDFEYILAKDRVSFAAFVRNVRIAMNEIGIEVSVDLAPKISADQPGLLYEGKDYGLLGEAANHVLLMTYEWGYTYGPPMAVAPINMVRRVVEYAVTEIPVEKINLGIPNYGYDWALPYERGVSRAKTIGNVEAVRIALDNRAEIQFNEVAQAPYFHYVKEGIDHEVWFEDVRSLRAKFELILEFNLRGAGYWQIMQLFRANWLLLSDMFRIIK